MTRVAHNTALGRRIGVFKYNTQENDWNEKCGATLKFDKGRVAVQVSARSLSSSGVCVCVCARARVRVRARMSAESACTCV
jgi:hypothetical protein